MFKKRGDAFPHRLSIMWMFLKIEIINFSSCSSRVDYNHYECYNDKIEERLRAEIKCLQPFQIYNNLQIGKDICNNLTEMEGTCYVGYKVVGIFRVHDLHFT